MNDDSLRIPNDRFYADDVAGSSKDSKGSNTNDEPLQLLDQVFGSVREDRP